MEILYIFIKDFGVIQNQGFNFGGEFRFHYDVESKYFSVEKDPNYIPDFYQPESKSQIPMAKINKVTSIIGQNGAGKSSLLNFIISNFASGVTGFKHSSIFVLKRNGNFEIFHNDELKINNLTEHKLAIKKIGSKSEKYIQYNLYERQRKELFNHTDFIYFSNTLDYSKLYEFQGLKNISTNYLVIEDYQKNNKSKDKNPIYSHLSEEIKRQILFITNYKEHSNLVSFKLPDFLDISISNDFDLINIEKKIKDNPLKIYFRRVIGKITDFENKRVKEQIVIRAFFYFFEELISIPYFDGKEQKAIIRMLSSVFATNLSDYLDKIDKILIVISGKIPQNLYSSFKSILDLNLFLEELNPREEFENVFFGGETKIVLETKKKKELIKFFDLYDKTILVKSYLNFKWHGLSSGEKAIFSLYSRFYSLSNFQMKIEPLKNNVIILLDEPDLYLHPQWQKSFLNDFLNFVATVFNKNDRTTRNIQIIFTSNSPIPTSDLFASNTIFLKRENEKTVVSDSIYDQKQTLAANIHTLFSDSFYLKDGFIGKFAESKINGIIRKLNRLEKIDISETEIIRKTILQIGEPIIKNKLMQMYNDRFNMEIHERLDSLEKKIKPDDKD
jgi:hypothetical protein